MVEQEERLVPLYRRAGGRLMLHGHEHNFQHRDVDGLHYVVSGAGSKLDQRDPKALESRDVVGSPVPAALPDPRWQAEASLVRELIAPGRPPGAPRPARLVRRGSLL
jgi:hypothetical protein